MGTSSPLRSALGIRQLSRVDADLILKPTPRDVLALRASCQRWGVPSFTRWELLLRALTHSSTSSWASRVLGLSRQELGSASLEFLGDRAVALAVPPQWSRTLLGNSGFALAAARMGVSRLLRCLPRHENEESALANSYEAIAGAVYIDGGIIATRKFVDTTLLSQADDIVRANEHLGSHFELLHAYVLQYYGTGVVVQVEDIPVRRSDEDVRTAFVYLRKRVAGEHRVRSDSCEIDSKTSTSMSMEQSSASNYSAKGTVLVTEATGRTSASARLDAVKKAYYILQNLNHASGDCNALFSAVRSFVLSNSTVSDMPSPRLSVQIPVMSKSRSLEQRERARITIKRAWSVLEPLRRENISACLELGQYQGSGILVPPVDDVLTVLRSEILAFTRDVTTLTSIAAVAEVGHRYYWLHLARSAYEWNPNAKLVDLQSHMLSVHDKVEALSVAMGGRKKGTAPLLARPCGKRMLFVALGIVYNAFGEHVASAWIDGGRRSLADSVVNSQ